MKKFVSILISILMVFGLVSCQGNDGKNDQTKSENKKITIVLDWTPNTNHTGLYVAKDKGFFEEEGLDVEITQPPEGSTTQLIGNGGGEFGISFQDFLAKNYVSNSPLPVTAVMAILQHNTSGIISLKEDNITRPKDLTGKRYSTWNDPIELEMLKYIVNKDGGDYESVTLVPYAENVIAQLKDDSKNGSDCAWVYYAWDGVAFKVNGFDTNFIKFTDYADELDCYTPVIIANDDYLANNSEEAKKVLSAIKKGYEYAIDHEEEACQILLDNAPELDENLVRESQHYINTQYIADAEKFGVINSERWNKFYDWLYDSGVIDKKIEKDMGFTNEYLD